MKTKKLLFLVAGFMLFALTAQAQSRDYHSFTLKNNNSYGVKIDYSVTGEAYVTSGGSWYHFNYSGSLYNGESRSEGSYLYGVRNFYVTISAMGHSSRVSLEHLIANGGNLYALYPGYYALLLCTTSGNHVDLEFKVMRQ